MRASVYISTSPIINAWVTHRTKSRPIYFFFFFFDNLFQSDECHNTEHDLTLLPFHRNLKGQYTQNENSVIIYSPSISKPVWMSLFCRTQRKIFWRKFVTRLFWGTIDFHSRKKKNTAALSTFFRIPSFVFSRTNTFIQVWKYLRMSKWQNFNFWVNYPFKTPSALMMLVHKIIIVYSFLGELSL